MLAGERKTSIEELQALGHIKRSQRKGVTKSCHAYKHGLITIKEKVWGRGRGKYVELTPRMVPRFQV